MLPKTSADMLHIHVFLIGVLHASVTTLVCIDLWTYTYIYMYIMWAIQIDVVIHFPFKIVLSLN